MGSLHKDIVLVLNRNWQAIGVKTPAETIGMLMTDTATALNIEDNDVMIPVRWKDWTNLPITDNDLVINTVSKSFKIPKVIVL